MSQSQYSVDVAILIIVQWIIMCVYKLYTVEDIDERETFVRMFVLGTLLINV